MDDASEYVPVGRFYKVIRWVCIILLSINVVTGALAYKAGESKGQDTCELKGLQSIQQHRDEYNDIIYEELNNFTKSDDIDSYILQ